MNFIIDPISNTKFLLFSKKAKRILKNYVKTYYKHKQIGGRGEKNTPAHNAKIKEILEIIEDDNNLVELFWDQLYDLQTNYDNKQFSDKEFGEHLDQLYDEIQDEINGNDYLAIMQD